jgi:transcription antitermination factor NusG
MITGIYAGLQWYAVEVASRKEKLVASAVADKGYECFLPEQKIRRVWSDRIKVTSVPLFGGYVFCRFDARHRLPVLVTPGVRGIVGTGKLPAPIPQWELDAIRVALRNGFDLEPCSRLQEGDRVVVTKGPLCGIEGTFLRHRGQDRLVLSVSLIQRSVAVEIDRAYVEPAVCKRMPLVLAKRPDAAAVNVQSGR